MSVDLLPEYVDPRRLARAEASLLGYLPLAGLERLQAVSARPDGEVVAELQFVQDGDLLKITGQISATLHLLCQRCLGVMDWPVAQIVALCPVLNLEAADALPTGFEPWLITRAKTSLRTLIEDELLLCLPVVAMHDDRDCVRSRNEE